MSNESQLVNALVGEAVKLLSSMGASAEIVGAFAVGYPPKVTDLIARHKSEAEPIDLEKLVQETMVRTLRDVGLVKDRVDTPIEASRTVNVEVKGKRTSVKVRETLFQSLSDAAGDMKKAKKLIQDFAEAAPGDTDNRSAWVEKQVNSYLLMDSRDLAGSVAH